MIKYCSTHNAIKNNPQEISRQTIILFWKDHVRLNVYLIECCSVKEKKRKLHVCCLRLFQNYITFHSLTFLKEKNSLE